VQVLVVEAHKAQLDAREFALLDARLGRIEAERPDLLPMRVGRLTGADARDLQDLRAQLQPIGKSYETLVGELEKAEERAGDASVVQPIESLRKKLEEFANPAASSNFTNATTPVAGSGTYEVDDLDFTQILGESKPAANQAETVERLRREETDRKAAEAELFAEKERAQVTLQSIGDAVITTDVHGLVEYLNPVAADLTGWSAADAQGRPGFDFRGRRRTGVHLHRQGRHRSLRPGRDRGDERHKIAALRTRQFRLDRSLPPVGLKLNGAMAKGSLTQDRSAARRFRALMSERFDHFERIGPIVRNVPPAFVLRYFGVSR
jgi:PAS domain-containing protein